jgi:mRNA interferase MazF
MVNEGSGYTPDRGDLIWLTFDPQAGHEQAGRRPAVVLSPVRYNGAVGLGLFCPVTSRAKGYPFEVALDDSLPVHGVVLTDQVKSLDWRQREATFIAQLDKVATSAILSRVRTLLA